MAPKKDTAGAEPKTGLLKGFSDKDTKLIAAAFLSSTEKDKATSYVHRHYDYALMERLTGNTAGTLKKMWPPVKRNAMDAHSSFAAFLGAQAKGKAGPSTNGKTAPAPKGGADKKRKACSDAGTDADDDEDDVPEPKSASKAIGTTKAKKASAPKGRGRPKKVKTEDEEDSADGGDGLGQYAFESNVADWLGSTDATSDMVEEEEV
ncbi:hypothetical protein GQ44DRAFT_767534 [Phaeosphaeriaceae sp. PMI808]|nr:hypothetical protein GQ44DRAFT_767534 [Phaeosphaeriaceae sp. PMI808]